MTKTDASRPHDLRSVDLQPLFVRLIPERLTPERRNLPARKARLSRVRAEFRELPGLSLTLAQATRLLGVSPEAAARILGVLVNEGLVRLRADGRYVCGAKASSRAKSA
jgi:hypothetical protein